MFGWRQCRSRRQPHSKSVEFPAESANGERRRRADAVRVDLHQDATVGGFERERRLGGALGGRSPGQAKIAGQPVDLELGAVRRLPSLGEHGAHRYIADRLHGGCLEGQFRMRGARRVQLQPGLAGKLFQGNQAMQRQQVGLFGFATKPTHIFPVDVIEGQKLLAFALMLGLFQCHAAEPQRHADPRFVAGEDRELDGQRGVFRPRFSADDHAVQAESRPRGSHRAGALL